MGRERFLVGNSRALLGAATVRQTRVTAQLPPLCSDRWVGKVRQGSLGPGVSSQGRLKSVVQVQVGTEKGSCAVSLRTKGGQSSLKPAARDGVQGVCL